MEFVRLLLKVNADTDEAGDDGDNGKENGNYYNMLGIYGDNGKENGNYHTILGLYE